MELRGAPLPLLTNATPTNAPRAETAPDEVDPEIRRVAEEFESVFLAEMLAPMFEALDTEGLGGGGAGERMFRPMLVQHYADSIAKSGGVGLADQIIREMMQLQMTQTETPDGADR